MGLQPEHKGLQPGHTSLQPRVHWVAAQRAYQRKENEGEGAARVVGVPHDLWPVVASHHLHSVERDSANAWEVVRRVVQEQRMSNTEATQKHRRSNAETPQKHRRGNT